MPSIFRCADDSSPFLSFLLRIGYVIHGDITSAGILYKRRSCRENGRSWTGVVYFEAIGHTCWGRGSQVIILFGRGREIPYLVSHISVLILSWTFSIAYLHNRSAAPTGHDNSLLFLKHYSPDSLGRAAQFTHRNTSLEVPDFDTTITATADNPGVVELQTCDAIIVRG